MIFTDVQQEFAESIRKFCERECGAKVKVTETAKKVALEGMQMMGGYGYATEYDMERHFRMALSPTIYAGTNEIQRDIISGACGPR